MISRTLRNIDIKKDITVNVKIRPGSHELVTVFDSPASMPLANDTSIGVGYAPLSPLESLVLELDGYLYSGSFQNLHPEAGEDTKIMAVRDDADIRLPCGCLCRPLRVFGGNALEKKRAVAGMLEQKASDLYGGDVVMSLNVADREEEDVLYLP